MKSLNLAEKEGGNLVLTQLEDGNTSVLIINKPTQMVILTRYQRQWLRNWLERLDKELGNEEEAGYPNFSENGMPLG